MDPESASPPAGAHAGRARHACGVWGALFAFTLPLASIILLQCVGRQTLMGGLSWQAGAAGHAPELLLAAFDVALALAFLFAFPDQCLGFVSLAWGEGRAVQRRLFLFAAGLTAASTAALALLAFTPAGTWFIQSVQGLEAPLAVRVQSGLELLVLWPLLAAAIMLCSGTLKRRGVSFPLALANILGVVASVALLLAGAWAQLDPLRTAIGAYLLGQGLRAAMLLALLVRSNGGETIEAAGAPAPSWHTLLSFFWPIAANVLLMFLSRPIIQWFLAREAHPEAALAGFGVAAGLGQIFWGWLNELRSNHVAFRDRPEALAKLPAFALALSGTASLAMAALFWTPLGRVFLEFAMGLRGEALNQASGAMAVFTVGPLIATLRAYHQGLGIRARSTANWFSSALTRVGSIVLIMLLLPLAGLHGATLAAAALMGGFLIESLTLIAQRPQPVELRTAPKAA